MPRRAERFCGLVKPVRAVFALSKREKDNAVACRIPDVDEWEKFRGGECRLVEAALQLGILRYLP
jgi:hypothetical protein